MKLLLVFAVVSVFSISSSKEISPNLEDDLAGDKSATTDPSAVAILTADNNSPSSNMDGSSISVVEEVPSSEPMETLISNSEMADPAPPVTSDEPVWPNPEDMRMYWPQVETVLYQLVSMVATLNLTGTMEKFSYVDDMLGCITKKQRAALNTTIQACNEESGFGTSFETLGRMYGMNECFFRDMIKFDKQTGRSKPAHYNNFIDMTSLSDAKKKTAKKSLDTCLSEKMELSTTAVGLFILLDDDAIASPVVKMFSNWMNDGYDTHCNDDTTENFQLIIRDLVMKKGLYCLISSLMNNGCPTSYPGMQVY